MMDIDTLLLPFRFGFMQNAFLICMIAVSYTHLTLPTIYSV